MGRKVKIEREPRWERNQTHGANGSGTVEHWDESEPFAMSQVGVLVHRVRYGVTYKYKAYGPWGKDGHTAVTYWCGNCTCNPVLLFDIPAGRMVCARCEAAVAVAAARAGKHAKRAADHVGHTVKLGAMVAVQVGVQRVRRKR